MQPQTHTPRVNFYATIHKALRAFMSDTLVRLGKMDAQDETETAETLAQVRQLLRFCATHLEHENHFVHVAMEAKRPGSSFITAEDHIGHEAHIDELEAAVQHLERSSDHERQRAATGLYRQLGLFVAENLEHMEIEESENNAVLWELYTDAELMEIHARLVATIPPEDMMFTLRWMLPHVSAGERAAILGDMRRHAPAPVFEGVLAQIEPLLQKKDWEKLQQNLELAVEIA